MISTMFKSFVEIKAKMKMKKTDLGTLDISMTFSKFDKFCIVYSEAF